MADLFEATCAICNKPKKVSNWLMVETMRLLNENGQEPADIKFSPENLAKLIELADAGTINSSVAKEVFERVFAEDVDPEKYVEDHGLKTVNDEGALRTLAEEVIAKNQRQWKISRVERKSTWRTGWTNHEGNERKSKSGYG